MQPGPSFHAEDKPLKAVLFADQKFRVPRYQRPYAWGSEQVAELWEDLTEPKAEPYFLGSFIFNNEHEADEGLIDIIDGQQRLLTITILLAVLRDCAKALDKGRAQLYQRKDICIEDRKGKFSYRILPAETPAPHFEEWIQKDDKAIQGSKPKTAEEKRVRDNYLDLLGRVSKELERQSTREGKVASLEDLRDRLSQLVIIRVDISREEDAYEIFETTNARGLELSVADLLKNLIFKKLPADGKGDYAKETWAEITSSIDATHTELRRFIRYFWMSKYQFLSEKKLYRAIKRDITDWRQLLTDLLADSSWYNLMLEGTEEDFEDLKHGAKMFRSLFAIRLLGVTQCYVLFLSIFRNIENLGTDPATVIQAIENFSFKYSVIGKQPTNKVEKLYSATAIKIEKAVKEESNLKKRAGRIQSIVAELQKELVTLLPTQDTFESAFSNVAYRNSEEGRCLVRYILSRVNDHLARTDEHKSDFNAVNIEHLLPQTPSKEWNLTKKEIKPYVNLLGNLTLLSKRINSQIQSGPIKQKLPELAKSELPITRELVGELEKLDGGWGEQQIRDRQSELAKLAYKTIWT
jgi:hypothetical protein